MNLKKISHFTSFSLCSAVIGLQPTLAWPKTHQTVFSHGLEGHGKNAYYYKKHHFIINPIETFDFYDSVNPKQSHLAGSRDVDQLRVHIKNTIDDECYLELMGPSRGGTVALYYAATASKQESKRISAVIAESPFARYSDIVQHIPVHCRAQLQKQPPHIGTKMLYSLTYLLQGVLLPLPENAADYLMKIGFSQCEPDHALLHVIHKLSPFIPVLLICSEEDTLVPAASTIRLYKQLKKANHPRVHLFVVKHGTHVRIVSGPNGNDYCLVVNAFREYYGLPHFEYASQHEEERAHQLFAQTQPRLEELEALAL